jgi:predicted amidohydrolase YtcJ
MLTAGSDYPVTTHNPWLGIYALLTRRDQTSGKVYGEGETLNVYQALRCYTTSGAYLTYEEDIKGSIEVGKVADLVVLDIEGIELLESDPELCFQMDEKVLMTLVGGEILYQKEGSEL